MTRAYLPAASMMLLIAASVCCSQEPRREPRLPPGTKALRDLEYVTNGHERQKLDLYLPEKADGPLPLIVWIHGGAWLAGNKDNPPALPFVTRGYAVASINYRLSQHAKFPAQIADCKAAIRWLRAHARRYNLDPDKVGVWGASAGGHLVALLGVTGGVKEFDGVGGHADQSSRVQCVVDFFGPSNFATIGAQSGPDSKLDHNAANSPESQLIGGPVLDNKDKVAKASPVTYVTRDAVPFLIVHGDKDPVVPCAQSEELTTALKDVRVPVTFKKIAGAGHGGPQFNAPELRTTIEQFFDKHLKAAGNAKPPAATPAAAIKVMKDFRVELLYSVPKDVQGSWVNMCVDPKGRLIVSDQYGALYRITPPAVGAPASQTKVERLNIPLGGAHGLLWAFDSLYVMVNEDVTFTLPDGKKIKPKHGLHRVRMHDGGDNFEPPQLLHELQAGGEHGAHAILPGPDGNSLYIICGNQSRMVSALAESRVPKLWGEDHLLPRLPDGNGFMRGVLGPGGCIYKTDPDGKNWELLSVGYRNQFDAAFNRQGELFTYDADMEWDMNTPWYRPTRVCLVTSGSEFGWRNGAGKWPAYYPDSLPGIYDIGPGSPTGICFGYGTRFPAKYQDALFMCDWSYGKLYAVLPTPSGSAYTAVAEEFLNGSPLPLTDVVANPKDGALYFTIGGRRTQSGLYRVTYVGRESTAPAEAPATDAGTEARALRHKLEALHGRKDATAVETAWPYLGHEDRFIRFAARVAIEHQEPDSWRERALKETDPARALGALLALVRVTGQDPFHYPRKPGEAVPGTRLKPTILGALNRLDWDKLSSSQRLDLLRVYGVLFNRLGPPDAAARDRLIDKLDPHYPARTRELNAELCHLLVYLEAPSVVEKTLKLLAAAPTQEEQLEYGRALRVLKTGWTLPQRNQYFNWLRSAARFKGGASLRGFLNLILDDAVASLSDVEKTDFVKSTMRTLMAASAAVPTPVKTRPLVKKWTLDELVPLVEKNLVNRNFDRGRKLFGEAQCFACHRFDNEGGAAAPDLTMLSGRYGVRDILEKVLNPNKFISDQYSAVVINTTDGKTVVGRIVNYSGDSMMVMTNMLDPNGQVNVSARRVESIEPSPVSMMPEGLLDSFAQDEVLDLIAYLLSRGDRRHRMFTGAPARSADDHGADRDAGAFFNGKDLRGWAGLEKYWSVRDGAIVGYTPEDPRFNTFLCSKRKYGDFELSFQVRLKDGVGNSGVQIRSRIMDEKKFTVAGPQADMGQIFWGSLYGENFGGMMKQSPPDLVKKAVKPREFNDYVIRCVGKHCTIKINGETMVDADFPKLPDEGIIAFQLHAGFKSMEVTFKDIKFVDLSRK